MYLYISLFSKQNTLITLHCIYLFYSLSKCLYIVLYIYIFILQINIIIFFCVYIFIALRFLVFIEKNNYVNKEIK